MKATVITDASFCPETCAAGWAAWVSPDKGLRVKRYGAFKKQPADSNEAELWAAINGVCIAAKAGATNILLQTDCMAVVHTLNKDQLEIRKALTLLDINSVRVKVYHVKGHTTWNGARYWVNRWCDARAGEVMRAQRKLLCK